MPTPRPPTHLHQLDKWLHQLLSCELRASGLRPNGDRIMMINHGTFGFQILETPYIGKKNKVSQWNVQIPQCQPIPLRVESPKFLLAKPYFLVKNELLLLTSEILVNFASLNLNCLLLIFSLPIRWQFQVEVCPSILRCFPSTGLPNQRLDTVDQSFWPPSAW